MSEWVMLVLGLVLGGALGFCKKAVCKERSRMALWKVQAGKYGKKANPGLCMTQEKALERGYRPAGQKPCR